MKPVQAVACLLSLPTATMIIGGLIVYFTTLNAKIVASAQHFASGILVAAVAWELTPALEAVTHTEKGAVLFGFIFGAFALMFIGRYDFKHWQSCNTVKEDDETEALLSKIEAISHSTSPSRAKQSSQKNKKTNGNVNKSTSSTVSFTPPNHGSPDRASHHGSTAHGEPQVEDFLNTDSLGGSHNGRTNNQGADMDVTIAISSSTSNTTSSNLTSTVSSPLVTNENGVISSTDTTLTIPATPGSGGILSTFATPLKMKTPSNRNYKSMAPPLEEISPIQEMSPRRMRFNIAGGKSPSRRRALQYLIELGEKGVLNFEEEEEDLAAKAFNGKLPIGLIIAIAIDCSIDGLLIGITFQANGAAGLITAIALAIEQLLLGISLGTSLNKYHVTRWKTMCCIIFIPFTVLLAGLAGTTILADLDGEVFLGIISFGVAGLLYLVTEELLIEAHEKHETDLWYISILFFAGFAFVIALDTYAVSHGDTHV